MSATLPKEDGSADGSHSMAVQLEDGQPSSRLVSYAKQWDKMQMVKERMAVCWYVIGAWQILGTYFAMQMVDAQGHSDRFWMYLIYVSVWPVVVGPVYYRLKVISQRQSTAHAEEDKYLQERHEMRAWWKRRLSSTRKWSVGLLVVNLYIACTSLHAMVSYLAGRASEAQEPLLPFIAGLAAVATCVGTGLLVCLMVSIWGIMCDVRRAMAAV